MIPYNQVTGKGVGHQIHTLLISYLLPVSLYINQHGEYQRVVSSLIQKNFVDVELYDFSEICMYQSPFGSTIAKSEYTKSEYLVSKSEYLVSTHGSMTGFWCFSL